MKKLWETYKEIILLFIGFILTTICGSFIGYFLQVRSWEHQHQTEILEKEKIEAQEIFSNISILMDTRISIARNLFYHIKEDAYKVKYREIGDEWNSNYNKNLALIDRYFGEKIKDSFAYGISTNFRIINENLGAYLYSQTDSMRKVLNRNIIDLNYQIFKFDSTLLSSIKVKRSR